MSNIGAESFSGVGVNSDAAFDVAFIGGEQGPNSAQQRQNQEKEDDVAFIGGELGADPAQQRQNEEKQDEELPPSVFSAGMPPFAEGGSDLLGAHHMPDMSVPPATVNYLGGTMLI